MERKSLRLPGECRQIDDEIDDKNRPVSVMGHIQPVPCFRVGRRWFPWRSPSSPPESWLVPGNFESGIELIQVLLGK